MQVPYLSRHAKVVTFDGRGNGKSDRPKGAEAYRVEEFAADGIAVMDATETSTAVIVAESCGALWSSQLAADHPDRVEKIVYIAPAVGIAPNRPERALFNFGEEYEEYEGWAKYNRHYWMKDYHDFLRFFFSQCLNEPHSSKPIEDCIGWALETTPETLVDATQSIALYSVEQLRDSLGRIKCPAPRDPRNRRSGPPGTQGAALADAVEAASFFSRARVIFPRCAIPFGSTCYSATSHVPHLRRPSGPGAARGARESSSSVPHRARTCTT